MYFDFAQYKQKGFIPILIILLIVLGVGGYFVYKNYSNNRYKAPAQNSVESSQTPSLTPSSIPADETENWKIYTNQNLQFSFKYPPDLIQLLDPNANGYLDKQNGISRVVYVERNTDNGAKYPYYPRHDNIDIVIRDLKGKSFREYVTDLSNREYLVDTESDIEIDRKKGIMQTSKVKGTDQCFDFRVYFFPIQNNTKLLEVKGHNANCNNFDKEFQLIISTFKFTQ